MRRKGAYIFLQLSMASQILPTGSGQVRRGPLSGLSLYREPFSRPRGSEQRFPDPSSNRMEIKSGLVSSPETSAAQRILISPA